jgi:hypothetical protein
MGCDYYITKVLQMYYNENECLEFEVERQKGYYYYDNYDEDEDNYEKMIDAYKKDILTPQINPIIIYINGKFNKPSTEEKYKTLIDCEIKYCINKTWSDITKIIKIEKRFER